MKAKNIIVAITLLVCSSVVFSSCEDYLNKKDDETMNFDKIWTKRDYILKYYAHVWHEKLKETDFKETAPFPGCTDDLTIMDTDRGYQAINNGSWTTVNVPYIKNQWYNLYIGIHEANIFLSNIDRCSDATVTKRDISHWKAEVRFLRAYYYFELVRVYGPVIIVGDVPYDYNRPNFNIPRNSLDECANYIYSEWNKAYPNLPDEIKKDDHWMGEVTKSVAKALIGRLKLYMDRPLYNGNPMYKNVKNKDGKPLFPQAYSPQKWKDAADANLEAIKDAESHGYALYKDGTNDPYASLSGLYLNFMNSEILWASYDSYGGTLRALTMPAVGGGGSADGQIGPTQELVDAFAMKNGVYPVTGYKFGSDAGGVTETPLVDPNSGYPDPAHEFELVSFEHPIDTHPSTEEVRPALPTPKAFVDREPRFYESVMWSGAYLPYVGAVGNQTKVISFAYNGNSGRNTTANYPLTGYMARKFTDPKMDPQESFGILYYPVIRLAELYLNYTEALIQVDPSNPEIFKYWNMVRERAGVPDIDKVYQNLLGNKKRLTDLLLRERRVEFNMEQDRYFVIRQWKLCQDVYNGNGRNGNVFGMNINAQTDDLNTTPKPFWERRKADFRAFSDRDYLHPMQSNETDRDNALVQNYGW